MVFAQTAHALSLNDICDTLGAHSGALASIRNATPPSRNGLSHANKTRSAKMAEDLFWETHDHLHAICPGFGLGYGGLPRRFKRTVNVVDSTTIQLVANCMDWGRHTRQKAAAKCHMRLDLQTFLQRFAIVKAADTHDSAEAKELCADIKKGEIVIFDKAYIDFSHLKELDDRGIFWVTRAKDNMSCEIEKELPATENITKDRLVRLKIKKSREAYPDAIRIVTAKVVVDGKAVIMKFMTNNSQWAASSICDLYKSRWSVEVFFKQIKQTLQLADFLGHSENAVRWQIWTALLTYLIMRFIAFQGKWKGSFSRLFTAVRGVLWSRYSLLDMLSWCMGCGTASGPPRTCATVERLYLPGFS
jgi:hypothetical protein